MKNIKTYKQHILNESRLSRNELFDKVEEYFNKQDDTYVKLNFEITHNYQKLYFTELYKYDGGIYGDDFSFSLKDENGKSAIWYMKTIDIQTLNDIVEKMLENS